MTEYIEVKEIGKGSFGIVKLLKDKDGKFYAGKEVGDIIDILVGIRETDILYRIKGLHPTLINIHDYKLNIEDTKYHVNQILEYCVGGSLEESLEREYNNPDKGIDVHMGGIRTRLENLYNVIETLTLLQNIGIYHMDIKTENILFRKSKSGIWEMCLCDFSNYSLNTLWKTGMDTPLVPLEAILYRPPEIGLLKNDWSSYDKVDVWAMGIVMSESLGAWEVVQLMDDRVTNRYSAIKSYLDKVRILQQNYVKRNPVKKGKQQNPFALPLRTILSEGILRPDLGVEFGKDIFSESSLEQDMLYSVLYSMEFSSDEFIEHAVSKSKEYFIIRKGDSKEDLSLLERVFREVVSPCLTPEVDKRPTMADVHKRLGTILDKNPLTNDTHFKSITDTVDELWQRIPDVEWGKVVKHFYETSKDVQIMYGKADKVFTTPINLILYAKRIGETFLEKMMLTTDDIIPKEERSRYEFYSLVYSACVFIASELMDFIFPYEDCKWFDTRPLNTVSPYIKLIMDLLMGELTTIEPNMWELKVLNDNTLMLFP